MRGRCPGPRAKYLTQLLADLTTVGRFAVAPPVDMADGNFEEVRRNAQFCALLGGEGARAVDNWHTADDTALAQVRGWWGAMTQHEYQRALHTVVGAVQQADPVMVEQGAGAPGVGAVPTPGAWIPPFIGVARFIHEARGMRRHQLRALRESVAGGNGGAEQGNGTDNGSDSSDEDLSGSNGVGGDR